MTSLVAEANRVEPEGTHVLVTLDQTGDTRVIWDPDKETEVASAERTFDEHLAKGYQAFAVKADGSKGKRIRTFNPAEEKIILAPALVGG